MRDTIYKTKDGYEYKQLDNYVVKQLNPQPFKYDSDYSATYDTKAYKQKSENLNYIRLATIIHALKKTPSKLLDFGYGNGDFLKVASKYIPHCHGYDVTGVPIPQATSVESPNDCQYDIVCFFDALEHVQDINKTINGLDSKYIIISLPCSHFGFTWDHWDFENWKHRKPNEHIWHFTKNSLEMFMYEQGYKPILRTNTEDLIRIGERNEQNILTVVFEREDNVFYTGL